MSTVNQQAKMFARITKVDAAKRLVYGRLAAEEVDKSNEVFDYEGSKPYFQRWSGEISKDTNGKSVGNMRAMHGKVAAGKFTEIHFNDADKAIDVVGKVVDDAEWKKCEEGVYTGFSIGGKYVDRKAVKVNDQEVVRYIADPIEGSLVDRPMIPSCKFFDLQRADGTIAKVEFQDAEAADTLKFDVIVVGASEPLVKALQLDQMPAIGHEITYGDLVYRVKEMKDKTLTVEKIETTHDIEATEEEVTQFLTVLSGASLKLSDVIDILQAAKGVGKMLAGSPQLVKIDDSLTGAAKYQALRKNLCQAGAMAYAIDSLHRIQECLEFEAFIEGDASPVSSQLKAAVATLCDILCAIVAEEKREFATGTEAPHVVAMSERLGSLKKHYPGRYDALAVLVEKAFPPKKDEEGGEAKGGEGGGNAAQGGGNEAQGGGAEEAAFAAKLHAVALKLGAKCDTGGGAAPAKIETGDLQKALQTPEGQAALEALVEKVVAPVRAELELVKSMPRPSKIRLRAVAKTEDVGDQSRQEVEKAVVKNADGSTNESASLIKQAHRQGGQPMFPTPEVKKG